MEIPRGKTWKIAETAAKSLSGYHAPRLERMRLVCGLSHEITKLGVKLLSEPSEVGSSR